MIVCWQTTQVILIKNPALFIKLLINLAVGMEVGYYFFTVFITLDTLYGWVATLQTCQK